MVLIQLFEFLTGTTLFTISTYGLSAEEIDDDHLRLLMSVVGPLPTDLCAQWPRYSLHYDDEGKPSVFHFFLSL